LKLIATDKKRHVFTAKNFDKLLELVTSLRRKACKELKLIAADKRGMYSPPKTLISFLSRLLH